MQGMLLVEVKSLMNELTEWYEIMYWAKIVNDHSKGPVFFTSDKQTREEIDSYKKYYKTKSQKVHPL